MGCSTQKPCAAQNSDKGAYPSSEEIELLGPWPWERRMIGRGRSVKPLEGNVTRSSRGTRRSGVERTTGLKEMMGFDSFMGMLAAAPMRVWWLVCIM